LNHLVPPNAKPLVTAAFSALLRSDVEQRELDRGGRSLSWFEAGEGAPTVVFEAGARSPVIGFAAVYQALAPDHRVIAYDRAGYGASDPAPIDLDLQLADLIAILEEAGQSILVGHSWGGLLAQLACWARPDLISGLVLLDPSHETMWSDLSPETRAELGRHPDRTSPSSDPRSTEIHGYARELATDVAQSVSAAAPVQELLSAACMSYLETDAQLFTYLDEVPMILTPATTSTWTAQTSWSTPSAPSPHRTLNSFDASRIRCTGGGATTSVDEVVQLSLVDGGP
jgi:pimeloyl-ACP methyl ester carboxylesterase